MSMINYTIKKTSGCSVESASKEKKKSENLLLNVSITG